MIHYIKIKIKMSKECENENCKKQASFNYIGEKNVDFVRNIV